MKYCACRAVCGDVAEEHDQKGAVCKGLGEPAPAAPAADPGELAEALLEAWDLAGGECEHGVSYSSDCPDPHCDWRRVRPALRRAYEIHLAAIAAESRRRDPDGA